METKVFAGSKIRRFRKNLGLTQVQMAEDLQISPSYLNLIERDQRPISARILLKLSETFDLDLRELAREGDTHTLAGLEDAANDPVLEHFELDRSELRALAEDFPRLAEVLVRLHTAYRGATEHAAGLVERVQDTDGGGETSSLGLPVEEVRDALQSRHNFFADLEECAERLRFREDLQDMDMMNGLTRVLRHRHNTAVRIMPYDVMGSFLRRYDLHNQRLALSEMLTVPARIFETAAQLGLFEAKSILDDLVDTARLSSIEAKRLFRVSLSKYFAAALLMPYDAFLTAAEQVGYDISVLSRRFATSFEQVCHRLTTLQRPGARGVGFFLVRVDHAGNVSKRFGGQVFPFARTGGACPRWSLYEAFRTPGRVVTQWVELPNGAQFFTLSRTVRRPPQGPGSTGQLLAIGLGCEAGEAHKLIYAQQASTAPTPTPIGVTCRLCERPQCHQRAHPPLRHRLYVDENRRSLSPFAFQ